MGRLLGAFFFCVSRFIEKNHSVPYKVLTHIHTSSLSPLVSEKSKSDGYGFIRTLTPVTLSFCLSARRVHRRARGAHQATDNLYGSALVLYTGGGERSRPTSALETSQ